MRNEHNGYCNIRSSLLWHIRGLLKKQPKIVRCKDCEYRGNKKKCILAFVADKQEFPVSFYDNDGKWFCADGKAKDGEQK